MLFLMSAKITNNMKPENHTLHVILRYVRRYLQRCAHDMPIENDMNTVVPNIYVIFAAEQIEK